MRTQGKHGIEELRCPKCGALLTEVYFLWASAQAWEVQRDENGQIIGAHSKWTGELMGPEYAFLGCSCELTEDEDRDEIDALLQTLQKYER
jgi:hypothetical protein